MTDAEIKKFRAAVTPAEVASDGPKQIYDRLKRILANKLYTVRSIGASEKMKELCRKAPVVLFKGDSVDIHKGGITMFVTGHKSTALYTGDCDMWQAFDVLKSQYSLPENKGLSQKLIVPHHGAKFICAVYPDKVTPDKAFISVGKNVYKHPSSETINALRRLNYDIICTKDIKSDIQYII